MKPEVHLINCVCLTVQHLLVVCEQEARLPDFARD
jgi:hypothetical protein